MTDEWAPFRTDDDGLGPMIPDGMVPTTGFRVVSYMLPDGTTRSCWRTTGDSFTSDTLGHIEEAKFRMLCRRHGVAFEPGEVDE